MTRQSFANLVESGLLHQVEQIVIESHRGLYEAEGRPWSKPAAYRWLRYEDPMPVSRLLEGTKKLRRRDAQFDADAVEKACNQASNWGFLN